MLWRVLQEHDGKLPDDAVVCFANTGKEEEATLRFVRDCGNNWNVPITWVEYRSAESTADRFRVVDFETASRNGEPFEALIVDRRFVPNPVARFCTVELKVRAMHRRLKSIGFDEWDSFVGMRADEPRRVAKIKNSDYGKQEERFAPLATAGVTLNDVLAFWNTHPFDLALPTIGGKTVAGNCDLCFLKTTGTIQSLIAEKPDRAIWWARMERFAESVATNPRAARFHMDRPSYAQMQATARDQGDFFGHEEEAISCFCGD
jgi:3'-phosphoadenosine 5'-phosphosulfate sulfotransferase (PAPS reductase)/FAD synthetase